MARTIIDRYARSNGKGRRWGQATDDMCLGESVWIRMINLIRIIRWVAQRREETTVNVVDVPRNAERWKPAPEAEGLKAEERWSGRRG